MKVIFLDIDGVLNCTSTPNPRKFPYIVDAKLLKRFKRLLQRTGAKVVLSSTWRYDPAGIFSAKHWGMHVPSLALADGLTREECDALADWRSSKFFDERERAALTYTDVMTREIAVPDAVFSPLNQHFTDRQIVELTVLIGTYNMNARVLRALELDLEP
jgi:hypothetical protein